MVNFKLHNVELVYIGVDSIQLYMFWYSSIHFKNFCDKQSYRGQFFQKFFDFCYRYRRYWISKGFDTPILNRIVFKKLQMALGGNMKAIIAGGAPLSPDVHEFLRICLRVNLAQVDLLINLII